MALSLDSFNDFMNQFMPMLVRQMMSREMTEHQAKVWLEQALKRYEAQEAMAGRVGEAGLERDLMRTLGQSGKKFYEGQPFSPQQLSEFLIQMLPQLKTKLGGIAPPPIAPEAARGGMESLLGSALTGAEVAPDIIGKTLSGYGYKPTADQVGAITAREKAGLERVLRERALKAEEAQTELGYAKIAAKEPKKKPSKKDDDRIKNLGKKITALKSQLEFKKDTAPQEEILELEAKINAASEELIRSIDEMDIDKAKMDKVINTFKSAGINADGLEAYKKRAMKEYKLSEVEFQYIKSRL